MMRTRILASSLAAVVRPAAATMHAMMASKRNPLYIAPPFRCEAKPLVSAKRLSHTRSARQRGSATAHLSAAAGAAERVKQRSRGPEVFPAAARQIRLAMRVVMRPAPALLDHFLEGLER